MDNNNFDMMTLGELSIKIHNSIDKGEKPNSDMINAFWTKVLLSEIDPEKVCVTFDELYICVMEVAPHSDIAQILKLRYDELSDETKYYCENYLEIAPPTL